MIVISSGSRSTREGSMLSLQHRNKRQKMSSAGVFIPSGTAQSSTGKERLRASNQEPPGRHVTREHQWGATVLLLVRPRKVGVT